MLASELLTAALPAQDSPRAERPGCHPSCSPWGHSLRSGAVLTATEEVSRGRDPGKCPGPTLARTPGQGATARVAREPGPGLDPAQRIPPGRGWGLVLGPWAAGRRGRARQGLFPATLQRVSLLHKRSQRWEPGAERGPLSSPLACAAALPGPFTPPGSGAPTACQTLRPKGPLQAQSLLPQVSKEPQAQGQWGPTCDSPGPRPDLLWALSCLLPPGGHRTNTAEGPERGLETVGTDTHPSGDRMCVLMGKELPLWSPRRRRGPPGAGGGRAGRHGQENVLRGQPGTVFRSKDKVPCTQRAGGQQPVLGRPGPRAGVGCSSPGARRGLPPVIGTPPAGGLVLAQWWWREQVAEAPGPGEAGQWVGQLCGLVEGPRPPSPPADGGRAPVTVTTTGHPWGRACWGCCQAQLASNPDPPWMTSGAVALPGHLPLAGQENDPKAHRAQGSLPKGSLGQPAKVPTPCPGSSRHVQCLTVSQRWLLWKSRPKGQLHSPATPGVTAGPDEAGTGAVMVPWGPQLLGKH